MGAPLFFNEKSSRFFAPREAGAAVANMVRAIAPPSVLYNVETSCISDSALRAVSVATASVACANDGGKTPNIALLLLDGTCCTLDAAFDAHNNLVKYWALSVREMWYPEQDMEKAIEEAGLIINRTRVSPWPVAKALWLRCFLTFHRNKWNMVNHFSGSHDSD